MNNKIGNRAPLAAGLYDAQALEKKGLPTVDQVPDGIQAHLQAFVDVDKSAQLGKPVITARSTREMLSAMGLATMAGGHILQKPFSIPQGHAGHADLARMKEGIRAVSSGIQADTGTYDKATGGMNPDKAIAFWKDITQGKGYVTVDDVNRFVTGDTVHDVGLFHTRKPGKVLNELELRLLFDVAAQVDDKGQRVLTADRFVAFLDGTLWQGLAQARAAGTLYQPRPVGEVAHEGPKKVAAGLAKLAAAYAGSAGDPGTAAGAQANLTIDVEASLQEQQRTKTLLPTIGGAMRALCPVGFG
jgi:hypothetical protein